MKWVALVLALFLVGCAKTSLQTPVFLPNGSIALDGDGQPIILKQKYTNQSFGLLQAQLAQNALTTKSTPAAPSECELDKEWVSSLAPSAQDDALEGWKTCLANQPQRYLRDVALGMATEIKIAGGQAPTETRIFESQVAGVVEHDREVTNRIRIAGNVATGGILGFAAVKVVDSIAKNSGPHIGEMNVSQSNSGAATGGAGEGEAGGVGGEGLSDANQNNNLVIGDRNQSLFGRDGPITAGQADKQFQQVPVGDNLLNNQNTQNAAQDGPTSSFFDDRDTGGSFGNLLGR